MKKYAVLVSEAGNKHKVVEINDPNYDQHTDGRMSIGEFKTVKKAEDAIAKYRNEQS